MVSFSNPSALFFRTTSGCIIIFIAIIKHSIEHPRGDGKSTALACTFAYYVYFSQICQDFFVLSHPFCLEKFR